jgi:hypothetical protein
LGFLIRVLLENMFDFGTERSPAGAHACWGACLLERLPAGAPACLLERVPAGAHDSPAPLGEGCVGLVFLSFFLHLKTPEV